MDKTEFMETLIGQEVVFTIPAFFGIPEVGVVERVECGIVIIDGEPYRIDDVEVE